jgi:hypothetical protein
MYYFLNYDDYFFSFLYFGNDDDDDDDITEGSSDGPLEGSSVDLIDG